MNRREVLRWFAATAGLRCLEGLAAEDIFALGRRVHTEAALAGGASHLRALDEHAFAMVIVAAERIIPATDTPGATDAGVSAFIDRMLADWYTAAERDRFLAGLAQLDERARALHDRNFIATSEADQTALLTAFDDEVTALRPDPGTRRGRPPVNPNDHWFAMLKYLTVWGYFTSEVALRETLRQHPQPGRFVACAPYQPHARAGRS